MDPVYLKLQPSEAEVFQAASRIYSAYLSNNQVSDGQEEQYTEKKAKKSFSEFKF